MSASTVPRVEVTSAEQLLAVFRETPLPLLTLALPLLGPVENASWERRLNALIADCGCDVGAVGLLGGVAISLIVVGRSSRSVVWSKLVAAAVVTTGVSAGAATFLGRGRSLSKARREALALEARLCALEAETASGGSSP